MKDFIILCAKIALGITIGLVLIFGGNDSIKGKSTAVQTKINTSIDTITF